MVASPFLPSVRGRTHLVHQIGRYATAADSRTTRLLSSLRYYDRKCKVRLPTFEALIDDAELVRFTTAINSADYRRKILATGTQGKVRGNDRKYFRAREAGNTYAIKTRRQFPGREVGARTRSGDGTIVDVAPSFGSNQLLSTLERRFALFTLCTNNDISVLVVGANS